MYKTLQTAAKFDPYNSDAYYFAQAAFTWEVGRAKEVNQMLDYGMKHDHGIICSLFLPGLMRHTS